MPATDLAPPPGQMYATIYDDPAYHCQCPPCRNARAVVPEPLAYGDDGYDQFGTDADGRDRDGCDHQQRHGEPGYRGADADDLDLAGLWAVFPDSRQTEFLEHLRGLARDPGAIEEIGFCAHCAGPAWDDDLSTTGYGDRVCESCYDEMSGCTSCGERFHDDDLYTTLGGSEVCDGCRDNYYSYCEDCEGYYHGDDSYEHEHDSDGSGCCDSPQPEFTVRNDGDEPLANDTRVTVTLPAGVISDEGLDAIRNYLRKQDDEYGGPYHYLACDLEKLGSQWQAKDGNYAKRLSRHAYKAHQLKLTPEVLSQAGNIARDHSTAVSVTIEVSRELNQSAGDWYHDGSCWWNSYSESRCALKTNGGFGLRSFSSDNPYASVTGRAWVLPLRLDEHRHLVPTFDTMTPGAFVVFNGYGDLSGYAPARILAHMAGWTYRKISFDCQPMYVNAGGYIIAPEEIAGQYTDGSLNLSVSQHASLYHDERRHEPTFA